MNRLETYFEDVQEGDENLVDCDLEVVTNDGETVIKGSCTAALPSRG